MCVTKNGVCGNGPSPLQGKEEIYFRGGMILSKGERPFFVLDVDRGCENDWHWGSSYVSANSCRSKY